MGLDEFLALRLIWPMLLQPQNQKQIVDLNYHLETISDWRLYEGFYLFPGLS